jgi:NAD-dependent dihydropyrimidine dehydrogenase PreA subunit
MLRKIIEINEEKCNGCGQCIPGCPEGALQVIDGKARLVSDLFCDGLGACIGNCPQGAMKVEEREAEPYDEFKVMDNVVKGGMNVIKAHLKHLHEHGEMNLLSQAIDYLTQHEMQVPEFKEKPAGGCPGNMAKTIDRSQKKETNENVNLQSELVNWPIQLQLLNPNASYLKNAELLISADCVPFAYANFHKKFLKKKVLVMFCPKLDKTLDNYVNKLEDIFRNQDIKSVTIVHMEVPCCSGVEMVVQEALRRSEKNVIIKDYTVSILGELV